ncbi:hypothetical protein K504DRAFT_7030 [Pleomassaria siparia CBS 279.74]|uniref:Uncharacterized protein n=1 Tax=Pleomassaria siparia CBS 279.74 TaxID=1314801 RepID=A0A6G1KQM4_9PLEO|nr:hypothetical protein K504DRAFT_7030 [Pleomassaria siparia CBS 279.74]
MNRDTSIMLRRSQKLGPLLNAHCEQHGKKFLVEWNFIYWYRAPTMENPHKTRGHSLRWDMTPNVFDSNYQFPLRGMSNGDTLEVVEGNPRLVYGPHVIHSHGPDFVGEDPDQHLIEYHGDDQGALQTIAALESANETLRMSNEDLQLKNMQLPRLQIAYDNLRRVNERWRADFADILRENAQPRLVSYSDSD